MLLLKYKTISNRLNAKEVFMGGGFLTEYDANDQVTDYTGDGTGDYYYDYGEGGDYEGGDAYVYEDGGDYPSGEEKQTDTKLPEDEDYDIRERRRRRRRRKRQSEKSEEYDYENVSKGGAVQTDKAWIYNGLTWDEKARMSMARDRPACSLVNMPNGDVRFKFIVSIFISHN